MMMMLACIAQTVNESAVAGLDTLCRKWKPINYFYMQFIVFFSVSLNHIPWSKIKIIVLYGNVTREGEKKLNKIPIFIITHRYINNYYNVYTICIFYN